MQNTLKNLHKNNLAEAHPGVSFEEYKNIVGIQNGKRLTKNLEIDRILNYFSFIPSKIMVFLLPVLSG